MIAFCLGALIITGAMYFPARNHDDRLPIQVTGRRHR